MGLIRFIWAHLALVFIVPTQTLADATFTPFLPPSYPLAVRNPYFSAWMPGSSAANLTTSSPQFWFGNELGWSVIGRVDGVAYKLFGVKNSSLESATVEAGTFSATHSIFTLNAGKAQFTLDFFSPVSFQDFTRQSLPFSYLTVSVAGSEGASPAVQVYSDIDETWTGQHDGTEAKLATTDKASVFQVYAQSQQKYSESKNEQALWGEVVWASRSEAPSKLTARSGPGDTLRRAFSEKGSLSGESTTWERDHVAALAHDLGRISSVANVTFALGFVRSDAINYLNSTAYTHYYRATYNDTQSTVTAFLDDYKDAFSESASLEALIKDQGHASGGDNYTDILNLSVLQTFGGIDVTIPCETLDKDNAYVFIKEISSDGNLNTIDIIVELIPFFSIFNIEYLRLMLNPVLDYLESGDWPQPFMIHDIGTHYPNATGHNDGIAEQMPVEECGNLLMMVGVIEKYSKNTKWTAKYASLFNKYAEYLVNNGLYPTYQLSTTDGLGAFTNMTQLGVKAAVALAAWGNVTGNATWTKTARNFAHTIYDEGLGTHKSDKTGEKYFTLAYNDTAFFDMFNLYPDKLLNLDIFPDSAYKGQSDLYASVIGNYGFPIEGHVDWGKTDWQLWAAAVADKTTKQEIIDSIHKYVSNGLNDSPFPDRYNVRGDDVGKAAANFKARPVLGAHFALWALDNS